LRIARRRRLPQQLLEHRQQLLGIGMFEENDAQFGAVGGAPIEIARDLRQPGHCHRVAAKRDGVGAVHGHYGNAAAPALSAGLSEGVERFGDFPRACIAQFYNLSRRGIAVDAGDDLAHPSDIVGEVGDHDRIARSGHRAFAADQRPHRLDRLRRFNVAQANDLGDEAARRSRAPVDPPARRRRGCDRLDAQRSSRRRDRDQTVAPERRQEHFEIFRTRQRTLRHDRDLALHRLVYDESPPGHPCRILDESADVRFAQVQNILRNRRRQRRTQHGQGKGEFPTLHWLMPCCGTAPLG
jgi:hypothetical protein